MKTPEQILQQEKYKDLKNLVLICEAMEEFATQKMPKKLYTVVEFKNDVKYQEHGSFADWENAESAREAVETDENYVEVLITDFPK